LFDSSSSYDVVHVVLAYFMVLSFMMATEQQWHCNHHNIGDKIEHDLKLLVTLSLRTHIQVWEIFVGKTDVKFVYTTS
jgi:hypothetical protein